MKADNKQYRTVNESNRQNPVVDEHGDKHWYNEYGELHREDGPAIERANGIEVWYLNNKIHREDGPAIESASGNKVWYINGKVHREGGPAIEYADGDKGWYVNGKLHREDGPAYEGTDGTKWWYVNNRRHSTIPEWVKALFIYKGHTPEKLGQERFGDLVRAFAQKMESMYES